MDMLQELDECMAENQDMDMGMAMGNSNDLMAQNLMGAMFSGAQAAPAKIQQNKSKDWLASDETYQRLLGFCSSDGNWSINSSQLLNSYMLQHESDQFLKILYQGNGEVDATEALQQYLLTVLALQVLTLYFGDKRDEWKMIQTKANKWCRSFKMKHENKAAIEQLEKNIKKMAQNLKDE